MTREQMIDKAVRRAFGDWTPNDFHDWVKGYAFQPRNPANPVERTRRSMAAELNYRGAIGGALHTSVADNIRAEFRRIAR